MRVLVCGGRDFRDYKRLYDAMTSIHQETPISVVIQGEARGADTMARVWAMRNGVAVMGFLPTGTRTEDAPASSVTRRC